MGKTALAVALAQRFDGEVINADSRQVYRGMTIGTAKPSEEELASVPHHLFDILDPSESFGLALFLDLAGKASQEIRETVPPSHRMRRNGPVRLGTGGRAANPRGTT